VNGMPLEKKDLRNFIIDSMRFYEDARLFALKINKRWIYFQKDGVKGDFQGDFYFYEVEKFKRSGFQLECILYGEREPIPYEEVYNCYLAMAGKTGQDIHEVERNYKGAE
jgi:hypothetical protein